MQDINKTSVRYLFQSLAILLLLSILLGVLGNRFFSEGIAAPLAVCGIFSLVVEVADILVWRLVAMKSPDMLTTFYTSASAFRMLLALATMFGYYMATDDGMGIFLAVFAVFYIPLLAHHSIFFARMTNSGKLKK